MVAETVKSYPYPALLPLATQQGLNYSCTTSCSSALLPQSLSHSYAPSPGPQSQQVRMDRSNGHMRSNGNSVTSALAVNVSPTPSGLGAGGMIGSNVLKDSIFAQRKQREFIPDNKKDESYWDRRRRNNEAAKRSREKRRFNDMILEQRVLELSKENHLLRAQVTAFENKFHLKGESLVNEEQVLASMPQADQILALTRRPSLSLLSSMASPPSLLSPSSLPSSPPASVAPSNNDDQYSMPQYSHNQHLEHSQHSPPQQTTRLRSTSPEYYPRDLLPQTQEPYSPEAANFYESTALNLSARSSRSPVHMEYCDDQSNRAVDYVGACLPHKLRHKNNTHGASMANHHFNIASHHLRPQSASPMQEPLPPTVSHHYQQSASPNLIHHQSPLHHSTPRPASPSTSPTSSTHLMYPIKSEPIPTREVGEESPGSSDDRDSGISLTSSPTLSGETSYHSSNRDSTEDMDCEGDNQLRAEVQRLAAELRSLKNSLTHRGNGGDRNKSNGQRR